MATTWKSPPEELQLNRGEVHIWRLWLDILPREVESLQAALSKSETERAEKFHFQKDRNRFVAAHSYTRWILGRYLKLPPEQILITFNEYGKPELDHINHLGAFKFNLSHSDSVGLFAVTNEMRLGVDVERIMYKDNIEEIAQRFFSAEEVEQLLAQPASQRGEAFFRCWTRKEAYIKAIGGGMSIPLNQFEVTFVSGVPPQIIQIGGDRSEAARWALHHIHPGEEYVGALAVEGQAIELKCFQSSGWPES